jgi:hypothetical protein
MAQPAGQKLSVFQFYGTLLSLLPQIIANRFLILRSVYFAVDDIYVPVNVGTGAFGDPPAFSICQCP